MPRLLTPVCIFLLLTGCMDKDAREYATRLSELLSSYQNDLDKRIQTEETFYRKSAEVFRDTSDIDVNRTLSIERDERSRELLAELQEKGRAPSTAFLQQRLRDYGNLDFDSTRRMLERETSAEADFLVGIHDLDGYAKNLSFLNKAIQELASAPSTGEQLKQLQTFVGGVKSEVDRLDCDDLKTSLASAANERKSLDASIKLLGANPELQQKNKALIAKLTGQIGELDNKAAAFAAQRIARACPN